MNYLKVVVQIFCLYVTYLLGVLIQSLTQLPVPGSIIGMILLVGLLQFKIVKRDWFSLGGHFLLKHLPLLFIPATVGVIEYLDLFKGRGIITILIVLISTVIVMVSSAILSDAILTMKKRFVRRRKLYL